jgi:simple sugar transport system permease protein
LAAILSKIDNRLLDIFTKRGGLVSAASVFLGFLTATLLLFIIGRNPAGMYQAILQVMTGFDTRRGTWNIWHIGEWLVSSIPLILCALSMAFAKRSGLFNIGAEGQYIAGITAAQFIALSFPRIPVLHLIVCILGAMAAGAVWGGIAGFLKARYKVSEVVSTIMMNYIALFAHRIITMRIPGSSTVRTPSIPETASLASPMLASLTGDSRLNLAFFFTIAALIIFWIVMEKTTLGFSLRAAGFNREAAYYAGMRVKVNITAAMVISGAFAGLAGASISLGVFMHGRVMSGFDGFGFDGIAVALAGNCSALGIALTGLLFGMLRSAQPLMQARQIPNEIVSIIMGLVVVFIALREGIRLFIEWRIKERIRYEKELKDIVLKDIEQREA